MYNQSAEKGEMKKEKRRAAASESSRVVESKVVAKTGYVGISTYATDCRFWRARKLENVGGIHNMPTSPQRKRYR